MRVLVNGASGSLGYWVSRALQKQHVVHESTMDITNRDIVVAEARLLKPDVIVHMAAMVTSAACRAMPEAADEVNVMGTQNVAEAAVATRSKLIYFSTMDVYKVGQPIITEDSELDPKVHVYAQTKHAGEVISREYVPDVTILRPGMTFGARPQDTSVLSRVIESHWTRRWVDVLMDPRLDKDYTAAANVAEITRLVLEKQAWGQVFNTGSGEARTYDEIMAGLRKRGIDPLVKFWPQRDYIGSRVFSTQKIREVLDYEPVMSFDWCVDDVHAAAGRRHAAGV